MMSVRKRPISPDGSGPYAKKFNFKLESESEMTDGNESYASYQLMDTASPHDTSDTSSKSEESEFEVASLSEGESPYVSSGQDARPDNVCYVANFSDLVDVWGSELSVVEDLSDSRSTSGDSEIGKADYWHCVKCNTVNKKPHFRYCLKCFRERKSFLPPRPKRRKRSHRDKKCSSSQSSYVDADGPSSLETCDSGLSSGLSQQCPSDPVEKEPKEPVSTPKCFTCLEGPLDGAFIHKTAVHVMCCYKCSVRMWMQRKRCPVCNMAASNILKVTYAHW